MARPPNILLITADDMNWDAVGAYGCPVPGTTPTIDGLAADGMRFDYAHVTIAVCQLSRNVMLSGRYPHRCRGEGFFNLREPGIPILPGLLRDHGYAVGILGKVPHSTPYADFVWDFSVDMPDLGQGRNPSVYGKHFATFVNHAQESDQPFFMMLNAHDPHRPFYGNDKAAWYSGETTPPASKPSKVFAPEAIETPGFLEDLPEVRREIAEYYSSVRRCDDTVAAALEVLRSAGCVENTLVVFLSDNGMAFPFAKTNCYLNSTRTPLVVRWPAGFAGGGVDAQHFVSGIDLMPTLLEAAGVPAPGGIDGLSFLPVLRGGEQSGRDYVFTQFHQNAGRWTYPMRCVQDRRFGYIWNPWSNGSRTFRNEAQSGRTMQAMVAAAEADAAIAERVRLFLHRVPEELYDFENDPDARHNLIADPVHQAEADRLRDALEFWMVDTGDPALAAFRQRQEPGACEAFVERAARDLEGRVAMD